MHRRIALVIVALLVPGGLLALMGAAVIKAFARSRTGQRALTRVSGLWRRKEPPLQPVQRAA
ncbi:MAG TPA: hypothetical protein VG496_19340 [Myxococcales bacterium]|nr:hypothetical protein [Myxococcales bacterium]